MHQLSRQILLCDCVPTRSTLKWCTKIFPTQHEQLHDEIRYVANFVGQCVASNSVIVSAHLFDVHSKAVAFINWIHTSEFIATNLQHFCWLFCSLMAHHARLPLVHSLTPIHSLTMREHIPCAALLSTKQLSCTSGQVKLLKCYYC